MPFGSIKLLPGVFTEGTPSLSEARIIQSSLIRFKQGLPQKRGGWSRFFYNYTLGGVIRSLWAWVDSLGTQRVAAGTTTELDILGTNSRIILTPQTQTNNPALNFTTTINTTTVNVVDAGYSGGVTNDVVFIGTPVSVGGLVLFGAYNATATGAGTYNITASSNATSSVSNGGAVPTYATQSGGSDCTVTLANHGLSLGSLHNIIVPVTVGGITLSGNYYVDSVISSSQFTIGMGAQATSTATVTQNSGNARLTYYLYLTPQTVNQPYGSGNYGNGPYGTGEAIPRSGTVITGGDWTMTNWGRILVGCVPAGPIYQWDPLTANAAAWPIATGPFANDGIVLSGPQQILIAWGSDFLPTADPLMLRWSDAGNFNTWVASSTNQAGSFRIPTGGKIMAVASSPIAILVLTDLDVWAMTYIGPPLVFGFQKVGSGCGLVSRKAVAVLEDDIYWMGPNGFYRYSGGGGIQPVPCAVWDAVFQNLSTANANNVVAGVTSEFSEVHWFFQSTINGATSNDSYVSFNTQEGTWDYDTTGAMPRTAWLDPPPEFAPALGGTSTGLVFAHETSPDADGSPLAWSLTTGYAALMEGEEKAFIDWMLPDFKYTQYGLTQSATVNITLNAADYPSDTATTYGPFAVTSASSAISPRLRNRLISFTISGNDLGSFARLGNIRYRYSADGRR